MKTVLFTISVMVHIKTTRILVANSTSSHFYALLWEHQPLYILVVFGEKIQKCIEMLTQFFLIF